MPKPVTTTRCLWPSAAAALCTLAHVARDRRFDPRHVATQKPAAVAATVLAAAGADGPAEESAPPPDKALAITGAVVAAVALEGVDKKEPCCATGVACMSI
mmetsp:Transcript_33463/g.77753  ORF Transcript_33463/g.77753 Transcript_33463/m.77753 type:complete len:101 (+) Transcript_33463:1312-1614(+)